MSCCAKSPALGLTLGLTESVCPVCLATIPAERIAEGDTVYLRKTCPEHGTTSTPIWRGLESIASGARRRAPGRVRRSPLRRSRAAAHMIAGSVPTTASKAAAFFSR